MGCFVRLEIVVVVVIHSWHNERKQYNSRSPAGTADAHKSYPPASQENTQSTVFDQQRVLIQFISKWQTVLHTKRFEMREHCSEKCLTPVAQHS
jgi:hypothetical protein